MEQPMPETPKQPETITASAYPDLKMPDLPPVSKPAPIAKVDEDYELEDISIVEDMTKEAEVEPKQVEVVSELKTWTPMPEIEKPLSKEELYKIEAAAESGSMKMGLMQLLDLGFTNFARNKELMTNFNMNVESVAVAILEDDELYGEQ